MDVRVRTNLTKILRKCGVECRKMKHLFSCSYCHWMFFFLSSSLISPTHLSFIGSAHIYLSTVKRIDNLDFFTVHTTALHTELR